MSAMKYATQNMPNIVSLENGNEEAVKHKRTCLAMSVPNSPRSLLLETDVFKITLRKLSSVSVGWVWTDGYSEKKTPGVSRNKDASERSLKSVKTILFAVFVLNKCCNALGIFLKLSGQQRIFYVMDSWTEGIILEGIKLIQTIILAYRNTMGFNKSVVTGYVAL